MTEDVRRAVVLERVLDEWARRPVLREVPEKLYMAAILERLSVVMKEGTLAGGLTGLDACLTGLAADCLEWLDMRQSRREASQAEVLPLKEAM
jgi:hypothetical protein